MMKLLIQKIIFETGWIKFGSTIFHFCSMIISQSVIIHTSWTANIWKALATKPVTHLADISRIPADR